ncbi:MAG TPA: hypothetical protein VJR89_41505 [Polyangiales bacterium]|nr:hypothetical protein [Polyangiales bacterium]
MNRNLIRTLASALFALATHGVAAAQYYPDPAPAPAPAEPTEITFALDRSPGIVQAGCVPYASGKVTVTSQGPVEVMDVWLSGLPSETEFDFFVIQLPNFPFGMSWYQGDMKTDAYGNAHGQFIGRFNIETFIVAPGVGPAPVVHYDPIADAAENPQTAPVHTFHLGLWFNSPADASKAGCPDAVTPFNGEHNAGVQVLNTASFPNEAGPLSQLK